MATQRFDINDERGYALIYMAVFMVALCLFVGVAVDTGRAYVVRAQLSKAVDGAALGAARMLNSGDPKKEASSIFQANFPAGYMGTTSVTNPATDPNFFTMQTIQASGVNIVTVQAEAVMPTSFMSLGPTKTVTVRSMGEAQRRMVDLSLVLDVSASIGGKWAAVRDASRAFVDAFAANSDRMALILYSNGAQVVQQMPSSRGFNKSALKAAIPSTLPGGSTNMVEGLYRGWDELRTVPSGQQSGLRVIVLFTDGASNGVPGIWDGGAAKTLRTFDFPKFFPDPDNQTHNNPTIAGFFDPQSGNGNPALTPYTHPTPCAPCGQPWCCTNNVHPSTTAKLLPSTSFHQYRRSSGIPTTFPLQTSSLSVRGAPQNSRRGLRGPLTGGKYNADVWNINNAARNLVEIIADAARKDAGGDYPIRIFTIGMGELVQYQLGTMPEMPEEILKRLANDKTSPDFNSTQLEGKYYFAKTEADVAPAFQALQSQIIRLTK